MADPADRRAAPPGGVLRAAGAMGFGVLLSRILGLVREQVFAVLFGAGNAMDAFNIAFRIPNLLRDLFGEGAMSAALVPSFVRVRKEEGERRGWRVAGLVFRVLFVAVSLIAVAGVIFAEPLVALYASAFRSVPGKFELTVSMTRIMFPFFPLVALAAAYMGILNALGAFFLPAFASALFNATSIVVGVAASFAAPLVGHDPIEGMAAGVVAGGLAQAFCQLPALYRRGYRWPGKDPSDPAWAQEPALRRMVGLMAPATLGLAATQINILVNSILATSQGPGAVSWLNYAFRLMQFPIGVFGVALAVATLPRLSELWVSRDLDGFRSTLDRSLRQVIAINLASAAGLGFVGVPIVRLIFEYGRFGPADTEATAAALAAYSVGLAGYSSVKVLVPACYAMGRTRIAVVSSGISVALNLALNVAFVDWLGYRGLALGTSLASILNAVFLVWAVRRELGRAGGRYPLGGLLRSIGGNTGLALVMGGACLALSGVLDRAVPAGAGAFAIAERLLKVAVLVAAGTGCVLAGARLFGVAEWGEISGALRSRLSGKKS